MKRGLSALLVLSMLAALFSGVVGFSAAAKTAVWGDVDGDGAVTSTDARLTLQYYAGKLQDTANLDLTVADVDGDNKVTSTDARLILQYYAGKISGFPVEETEQPDQPTDTPIDTPAAISPNATKAGESFDDWADVKEVTAAHGITRFGFTMADNSGLPFNVACCISDTEITAVVPAGVDLTALRAKFSFGGQEIRCGDAKVTPDTVWNLTSPKTLTVVAANSVTHTVTLNVQCLDTGLPSMAVTLSGGATVDSIVKASYTKASVYLGGGDASVCDYAMEESLLVSGKIKGRGNSSWGEPKKGYTVKLDKKASLLGMSKSKGWALIANYGDKSLLRNAMASYLATESGVAYVMKVRPVDLWLNGEYWGTYNLTEKVDIEKERVNISKVPDLAEGETIDDVAAASVGYLLEFDGHVLEVKSPNGKTVKLDEWETYGEDWKTWEYTYYDEYKKANKTGKVYYNPNTDETFFKLPYVGKPCTIKDPDTEELSDAMREYIFQKVMLLDSVLKNRNKAPDRVAELLDLEAFMRWCVVEELTDNTDSSFHSSVYMTLDVGGKFVMGPVWDFDRSMGNCRYWNHENIDSLLGGSTFCRYVMDTAAGRQALKKVWAEFAGTSFTYSTELDRLSAMIAKSAAYNFERWPIMNIQQSNESDASAALTSWDQHVDFIDSYLMTRFGKLNDYVLRKCGG